MSENKVNALAVHQPLIMMAGERKMLPLLPHQGCMHGRHQLKQETAAAVAAISRRRSWLPCSGGGETESDKNIDHY